jgi:lipopolysaccharide biosynthesis glycosyltransferase
LPISGSKAVVFGFDENYAPAGLLSMFSMFINSRSRDYEVYILTDSLSSSTVSKIDHIGRIFSRKIVIKRVPLDNIKNTFPVSGHISAAA